MSPPGAMWMTAQGSHSQQDRWWESVRLGAGALLPGSLSLSGMPLLSEASVAPYKMQGFLLLKTIHLDLIT